MLLCLQNPRDDKIAELLGRICDAFNLKPDEVELGAYLLEGGLSIKVILEPSESEFHELGYLIYC